MTLREIELTPAATWRSDYERSHRMFGETYNVTTDYSKRLRAQLIKAQTDVELSRLRDGLLRMAAHINSSPSR